MEKGQKYDAVVIVDGVTITQSFETALALPVDVIDVPLLFGNMAHEPDEGPDDNVSNFTIMMRQWHNFLNLSFVLYSIV